MHQSGKERYFYCGVLNGGDFPNQNTNRSGGPRPVFILSLFLDKNASQLRASSRTIQRKSFLQKIKPPKIRHSPNPGRPPVHQADISLLEALHQGRGQLLSGSE